MTTICTDKSTVSRPPTRTSRALFRPVSRVLEVLGRRLVKSTLSRLNGPGVRFIDEREGTVIEPVGGRPAATVHVIDPSAYRSIAFGGTLGAAESYMDGAWTTGNLPALIETLTVNFDSMNTIESPIVRLLSPISSAAYWLDRNTRAGSRRNIAAHYDLGNEFFRVFLDPTMTYSCGIFKDASTTLEQAQIEKIDRACRKLQLRPDDHLLEIGTGWGALAVHAARRYGCRVTTTTISEEQHHLATRRVQEAGLAGRVTVLRTDYRDIRGEFDKIVSIEMLEAVGAENLRTYFDVCSSLLKADGAALVQSIVIRDQYFRKAASHRDFVKKYIFPGSCIPSVAAIIGSTSRWTDLRVWHIEDIGPHYATTLRLWREAFMARRDDIRTMGFDERFIRMWEYYLSYCEGGFLARHLGDVQVLFTKPLCRIPPTAAQGDRE